MDEPIQLQPMLTVKEAADVLQVSVQTIYAWVRGGQIAAVRIGQTVRIPREALPAAEVAVVEEGEKNSLARLLALLEPSPEAIDELEQHAREQEAKEPPHHGEAQVLVFENSRVR